MPPVSKSTPLLSAQSISKSYRLGASPVPALRDVSLDVRPGEFIAIRGPSGSGKTTLLNVLGLLDVPDLGAVFLDGANAVDLAENTKSDVRRDRFGFVFQTFNLIPVLTAEENVAYPLALAGLPAAERRSRARALLAAVGCADKIAVRPDLLSGGERQRVAIARALANGPAVVFADEPTANLDSKTADEILDLMRRSNEERGAAFLFATHDPRVVERAKRVISLTDGRITEDRQ